MVATTTAIHRETGTNNMMTCFAPYRRVSSSSSSSDRADPLWAGALLFLSGRVLTSLSWCSSACKLPTYYYISAWRRTVAVNVEMRTLKLDYAFHVIHLNLNISLIISGLNNAWLHVRRRIFIPKMWPVINEGSKICFIPVLPYRKGTYNHLYIEEITDKKFRGLCFIKVYCQFNSSLSLQ